MLRSNILFVSLVACINLIGCSKGPSNKDASNLAFNFLSGMIPGITQEEISILKTFEKEGDTIVVVKAGEMLCNMPVIKRKDRWIASSILCNGQFESPEKASIRALNYFRSDINAEIDKLNTTGPYISRDGSVRYNKAKFDNNAVTYDLTLLDTKVTDCNNELITEKIKPLIDTLCTDSKSKKLLVHDISYEFNSYDSNGNVTVKHIVNEDICNNKLYCKYND